MFPLDAAVVVDGESLPSPYHVYDGTLTLVGGTVDAAEASRRLAAEDMYPVKDDAGRALAAVWVGDFRDASLGPHSELQISLFGARRPGVVVKAHPYALFRVFTGMPDVLMVCFALWNGPGRVARYNRDHLALDARAAAWTLESLDGEERFRFVDEGTGEVVAEGRLASPPHRQSLRELAGVFSQMSLGGFFRMARAGHIEASVANTRRSPGDSTLVARTYTTSDRQSVRRFGGRDHVIFPSGPGEALGFEPSFVQVNSGLKFVYLRPEKLGT